MKSIVNPKDLEHVFSINPDVDHLLVTEDGHIFVPKNESFCKSHCTLKNIKYEKAFRPDTEDENNTSEGDETPVEDLTTASFIRLKEICKGIDERCVPKSKNEAIAIIEEYRAANSTEENTTEDEEEEEINPIDTVVDSSNEGNESENTEETPNTEE